MEAKNQLSEELRQFLAPTDGDDEPDVPSRRHGPWGPGIKLMRNLQFVAKAALICSMFVVPMALLAWSYYSQAWGQLRFSQKERLGVQVNRQLLPVIKASQLQRGGLPSDLPGAAQRFVQGSTEALQTLDALEVQTRVRAGPGDAGTAQGPGLLQAMQQVADASNLRLDPDIDTNYLSEAVFFRLPDIGMRLMAIRSYISPSAPEKPPAGMAEQLAVLQFQIDGLAQGLAKASASRPGLREPLQVQAAMERLQRALQATQAYLAQPGAESAGAQSSAIDQAFEAGQGFSERLMNALDDLLLQRVQGMQRAMVVSGTVMAVGLVLALYFFYSFFLVTRGGLLLISRHLDEMAEGDLRNRPRKPWGSDEPAKVISDLRKAYDSLHVLIRKVRHAARALHGAAGEISTASTDLGARTEAAAAALEQQATSMENIRDMVNTTAERATMSATFAVDNADSAERGGRVFEEVVSTMRQIHQSSQRIGDIIGVIDGIAFQTNILALNAAVEAARAGEQGRGFAVVANEVRTLAKRSADAAAEIKSLISESVQQVETGTRVVEEASVAMKDVVTNARQINAFLGEISDATREQANLIHQVGDAVRELDLNTQQNAGLVQHTNAAASALTAQADALQEEIANFRVA